MGEVRLIFKNWKKYVSFLLLRTIFMTFSLQVFFCSWWFYFVHQNVRFNKLLWYLYFVLFSKIFCIIYNTFILLYELGIRWKSLPDCFCRIPIKIMILFIYLEFWYSFISQSSFTIFAVIDFILYFYSWNFMAVPSEQNISVAPQQDFYLVKLIFGNLELSWE